MKKFALALVAVLMFTPVLSVRAMTISEYVDHTFMNAPQPNPQEEGDEVVAALEKKLLPIFKQMATMLKNETYESNPEAFEQLWKKVERTVSEYTDEITEEDLEEFNIELRSELASILREGGMKVTNQDLDQVKITDLSIMKTISNFILLKMLVEDLSEKAKLTKIETLLLNDAIMERMLIKMMDFIPAEQN